MTKVLVVSLLLVGCASPQEELFNCSQTSDTATCLQMRYGYSRQEAQQATLSLQIAKQMLVEQRHKLVEDSLTEAMYRKSCYGPACPKK